MGRARILTASLALFVAGCGGTTATSTGTTSTSRGTSAANASGSTGRTSAATTSSAGATSTTGTTATSTTSSANSTNSTTGNAASTTSSTSATTGNSTTGSTTGNSTTGTTAGNSTTGTTAGNSSTGTTAGNSTTGSTTGSSCPGYALPNEPANCNCGRPGSCSANNCYNGYLCRLSDNKCVPPSACSTGTTGTTGSSTTGTASTSTTTSTTSTTGSTTTGTTGSSTTGGTTTGTTGSGQFRVLFDSAHNQVAGSACWVIDSNAPSPQPASPSAYTDWNGGISNWGYDLFASGRYTISELPSGTALSYGGGGAGDLTNFDVFISDEPEADFSSSEQAALVSFLNAGKGVMLVSDHAGAVRCSGCIQAATVINDFLVNGAGTAVGAKTDVNDIATSGLTGNIVTSAPLAPVFSNGPFGAGSTFSFHAGTSVSVTNSAVAQVVVDSSAGGMIIASQPSTGGRFVLIGDSSPEENASLGSGSPYSRCVPHNGWGEANDRQIVLNATAWLAHDGS